MIEQLFGSKTRVKLLKLFYTNDNRSFYVREITRKIDEQINSVRRELANLLNIGIITSDNIDNKVYYQINKKYQYYKPLYQIFADLAVGQSSTNDVEEEELSLDFFKSLGQIDLIVYTGQLTNEKSVQTDVLIVGNVNKNAVAKYIAKIEADERKNISYTVLTLADFELRMQIRDRFLSEIFSNKYQLIIDTNDLIKRIKI